MYRKQNTGEKRAIYDLYWFHSAMFTVYLYTNQNYQTS